MKQYLFDNASGEKLNELISMDGCAEQKATIVCVENAVILPRKPDPEGKKPWGLGGVCTEKGLFVKEAMDTSFGGTYDIDDSEIVDSLDTVVYLGYTIPHWGVFLVDFLRRAYALELLKEDNLKVAYIGINFKENTFGAIDKNCHDFFEALGIEPDRLVDIRKPTRFKKVYVPEPGYNFEGHYFDELKIPYEKVAEKLSLKNAYGEKIYLTRTHFSPRKEFGEKFIEDFFAQNGYRVVSPEKLSLAEQVSIFYNASEVASIEGTIAHNILFSKSGIRQIILRKQSEVNSRQIVFDKVKNIDITYIDCYYEPYKHYPINHDIGPFLLLFNKNLRKFAKDYDMSYSKFYVINNLLSFLKYSLSCIAKGIRKIK